jgi:beta-lactamase superfamily II metal-dependent hydrolase
MKRFVSVVLVFLIGMAASAVAEPQPLRIHWIDVEGGAATLVVTPAGESILFDTGMPGLRDPVRINRHCRKIAGLKKIDHLVITHFDKDHYGGAADLSQLIPIGHVYDHGVRPQDVERVGEEYLKFACEQRLVLTPGDQIPLKQADETPELSIDILAALQRFIEPTEEHAENARPADAVDQDPDLSHNANSIVALLHFGNFDFLDAADLTWNLEERLVVPRNLVGEVDVYQTDHHGLDRSNNPTLIRSIKPKVAIMNNGHTKGCGPLTFAALKSTPSIEAIYQVHKNLRDDGSENNTTMDRIANTTPKENCTAHPILMAVAADGKSYVVEIPATGLREEYAVK